MEHHFNIEVAIKHGVNEAIFLHNISFWVLHNKANNKNFHENRYWTFCTQKALENLLPYFSRQSLRTIINSCVKQNLLIVGNFNKKPYDKTAWYTFTDTGLELFPAIGKVQPDLQNEKPWLESTNEAGRGFQGDQSPAARIPGHWLESTTPLVRINQPIPDINKDNKQKIKDMGEKPKKKSKKLPTLIPDDFMYTPKHQELATSLGLDISFHFQDFKDKAVMKGTEWICWNAAFMNWLRKAPQFIRPQLTVVSNNQTNYQKKEVRSTVPWFTNNH